MKYHVSQNSTYIEIVKIRYKNELYMKCWVRWYSKSSNTLVAEHKSMKIPLAATNHWEKWND